MNNSDMMMHSAGAAGALAAIGLVFMLIELAVLALMIASMWKIFTKAGLPGWASIIPIYNLVVLCKLIGKPGWWWLLLFVPIFDIYIAIMMNHGLSKSFGKDVGFTIGLLLLGVIFLPILAFGDSKYVGPGLAGGGPLPAVAA